MSADWAFLAGLSLGFIAGALLMSMAATELLKDRIAAGVFETNGVAYRIQEMAED